MSQRGRASLLSGACVVLVRPRGPVNIGLSCRALANLGIADLRLVRPATAVSTPESRKFALHARDVLKNARVFDSLADAVVDCASVVGTSARRRLRGQLPSWTLDEAAAALRPRRRGRIAVVFGSEREGLRNEELDACEACIRLETPGPYPSYNLSHAVAITLYGLAVAAPPTPGDRFAAATQREVESLHDAWLATLDRVGYFRRTTRARFAPKLRRLLGRLQFSRRDANTLRGMLAHIDSVFAPPRR